MVFGQNKKVDFPVFGEMKYRASYWLGQIRLDTFSTEVEIILRAKKDGPTSAQIRAMTDFLANQHTIKTQAISDMLALFKECGVQLKEDELWKDLEAAQIELTDENYDVDTHDISILVIFSSQSIPEFCPAIEIVNGHFAGVLSGT